MDALTILAVGIPSLGLLALGVAWLANNIIQDVSLRETNNDENVDRAEKRADALELQLRVAEDLGIAPETLNRLYEQSVDAREDAIRALADAEQAKITEQRNRERGLVSPHSPMFSPVAAIHSTALPINRDRAD